MFHKVSVPSMDPEVPVSRMCWPGPNAMAFTLPSMPMCQWLSFQFWAWTHQANGAPSTRTKAPQVRTVVRRSGRPGRCARQAGSRWCSPRRRPG